MVRVVVPLRRVLALAQEPRLVRVVLQDQVNVAARKFFFYFKNDLVQNMRRGRIMDSMHGIEAKAVETISAEPVKRVMDEVFAHPAPALAAEIDGSAPRRLVL